MFKVKLALQWVRSGRRVLVPAHSGITSDLTFGGGMTGRGVGRVSVGPVAGHDDTDRLMMTQIVAKHCSRKDVSVHVQYARHAYVCFS